MQCLLCTHSSTLLTVDVYQCSHCDLVFKAKHLHLNSTEEKKRYSHHQNQGDDPGYLAFLDRVLIPLKQFLPMNYEALDFGCGPGPILARNLNAKFYDPFFFPDHNLLTQTYDVVTCTEVVEHFYDPQKSWNQLMSLVKPGGVLAIMTQLMTEETDYQKWWYKNDPTHVVFYSEKTMDYFKKTFHCQELYNDHHSVVIFRKL